MPTGLTGPIYEGTDMDLNSYLWRIASQAFHHGEIPLISELRKDLIESYAHASLAESQARLSKVMSMGDRDFEREEREREQNGKRRYAEALAQRDVVLARYNEMRAKVEAWEAPTPDHAGLKSLAIRQINESIQHDCRDAVNQDYYLHAVRTTDVARSESLAAAKAELSRSERYLDDHLKRINERLTWLEKLEKVIGPRPTA